MWRERGGDPWSVGPDNGLTYLNNRYYDPAISRFLAPDPLMAPSDPSSLNPYTYAASNPITYSDPDGLEPRPWHDPN